MTADEKLDKILEILTRMDQRQTTIDQRQTTMKQEIEDIQEHEPLPTGSFGTTESPKS